jgi:anti-sigma regulatory factor (Ser/Thr protein kinase)
MSGPTPSARLWLNFSLDLSLLGVARAVVQVFARQQAFSEPDALNLTQAVEQACRLLMRSAGARGEGQLRLRLESYADHLEVVVEDGPLREWDQSSADAFLMTRGVDRLVQEESEPGRGRLTLIKYRRGAVRD